MKKVSITDDNGKVYEFETNKNNLELLKVVQYDRTPRIVGYYYDGLVIEPMSWSLDGIHRRGEDVFDIIPTTEELTLEQVCKELGREVKIVKG